MLDLHGKESLVDAITAGATLPVAFLVGSPLSWDGGGGVPGVSEMISVARELVGEKLPGRVAQFESAVASKAGADAYQAAMKWLHGSLTQAGVNEVIRRAVMRARLPGRPAVFAGDGNPSDWYVPPGLIDLAAIVSSADDRFPGPILTTNFDPLISVAIRRAGGVRRLRVIDADGSLPRSVEADPGEVDVVHLHGYWQGANTLHTPAQLTSARPRLVASLRSLLNKCTLVVVAYSGWDDAFTAALADALHDADAQLTVLWCFRESDPAKVQSSYGELLSRMSAAITSGQLHLYGGVDCHAIFSDVLAALKLKSASRPSPAASTPLAGWLSVTSEFVEQQGAPDALEYVRFFDGALPTWRVCASQTIPVRSRVDEIRAGFDGVADERCTLTLVRGAGGEGKSTVLMQFAAQVAKEGWDVLFRLEPSAALSADAISKLDPDKQWLLIVDDAADAIDAIYECLSAVHAAGRANVDFLLASRDAEWTYRGGDRRSWPQVCQRLPDVWLSGFTNEEEARAIVRSWASCGPEGLRSLAAIPSEDQMVRAVLDAERNDGALQSGRGSFLGALLEVRFSPEALRAHVRELLVRLEEHEIGLDGQSLRDALVYIAACQSAGINGLDVNVLADLVGVPRDWILTRVVKVLGAELGVGTSSNRAFTRHQRVAGAIITEAETALGVDLSEVWSQLVRQVAHTSRTVFVHRDTHARVLHIGPRLKDALPAILNEARRAEIAVSAARAGVEVLPERLECVIDLASTLRNARRLEEAIQLMERNQASAQEKEDFRAAARSFWFEWAVCEGQIATSVSAAAANVWLAGVALSDLLNPAPVTAQNVSRICVGLGVAMSRLLQDDPSCTFAHGRRATTWIGYRAQPDDRSMRGLDRNNRAANLLETPEPASVDQAIEWLSAAVREAGGQTDDRVASKIVCENPGFMNLRAFVAGSIGVA